MPPPAHERLRTLLDMAMSPGEAARAWNVIAPLGAELERYTEIIVAPGEVVLGFMTRGEDASFTNRCAALLAGLGMPPAAIAHHRMLATWFDHRRAFLKVEWRRDATGPGEMTARASCYFRRRPALADVVARLALTGSTLDAVLEVARATGKRSVHFVAAAFAADKPVEQKLYFSQYASPESRTQMAAHVDTLLERFAMTARVRDLFSRVHPRSLAAGSPTFFLSINIGPEGLVPSLKLDYPDVPKAVAGLWIDGGERDKERAAAAALADRICGVAGTTELTYLGVRFQPGADAVRLKYYVDLPQTEHS